MKHPSEVVKKGMELDVIVLDIDIAQRRISLGHKQVSTDPWSKVAEVYTEGADATGTVAEINDGGVVVDLPLDVEAFVPASHLQRSGRPMDSYQIGDELELQVIRMDREDRELVMSETAKVRSAERAERNAENRAQQAQQREERRQVESYGSRQSGPATLGEISGLEALRQQMAEAEAREPVGEDASEAQSKAVQAEQPEEKDPPVVPSGAASDLSGQVGTKNRGTAGKNPDMQHGGGSDSGSNTEPPHERSQRVQEGGDYPAAEKNQAALKGGGIQTERLAGQVEAAVEDETPNQNPAVSEPDFQGPNVDSTDDVDVPEELSKTTGQVVSDALGTDGAPEADTELGGASATVEGDLDALRGEDTDEEA